MGCCRGAGQTTQYVNRRWTTAQVRNRRQGGTPDLNHLIASISLTVPSQALRRSAAASQICDCTCDPSVPAVGPTEIVG